MPRRCRLRFSGAADGVLVSVGADLVGDALAGVRWERTLSAMLFGVFAGVGWARLRPRIGAGSVTGRAAGRHPRRSGSTVARERRAATRLVVDGCAPSRPDLRAGSSTWHPCLDEDGRPSRPAPWRAFSPCGPRFHKSRRGWRPTALPGGAVSCGKAPCGVAPSIPLPTPRFFLWEPLQRRWVLATRLPAA